MKILHLSGAMSWGGNEQQMVDLIHHSKALHTEHIIFCFQNSPVEQYAIAHNLAYTSAERSKPFAAGLIKRLAADVKTYGIEIIHIHTSNFVTTCVLADLWYKMKTPTVFFQKGDQR